MSEDGKQGGKQNREKMTIVGEKCNIYMKVSTMNLNLCLYVKINVLKNKSKQIKYKKNHITMCFLNTFGHDIL